MGSPEGWATWTVGRHVSVDLREGLPDAFTLVLEVASAYGPNRGAAIRVAAGSGPQTFVVDRTPATVTLAFDHTAGVRQLTFDIPFPQSPAAGGDGADTRQLGIALVSATIQPRPAAGR
jgi:hypothetical protein